MKENTKDIYKIAFDAQRKGKVKSGMEKLKRAGWSISDIAAAFGVSENGVRRTLNSKG